VRAAVNTRYGSPDVIEIREVPKPLPKPGEVLVKVHASTVNRTDCGFLRAHPFPMRLFTGLSRPRRTILGMDFAGVVETVGADVKAFRPGDRVFGLLRYRELGAHAEHVCVPEDGYIATMRTGVTFEEAVVGEGAFYAYASLMQLGLKRGQRILIYGASGAIGTAAVQLAKSLGADVTAVVATRHVDLAKSLGATRVIDYTAEDFTRIGETFDCMLDAVGKASYSRCQRLLKPGGVFAATDAGPGGQTLLLAIWSFITGSKRVQTVFPRRVERFVDYLKERMEAGEFRAVIDRRYPLEAIADAYRYVEQGQKTGIVVVNVTPASDQRSS
jgi:NADPH:quinone reductase-like Zn-dependent oxidoreductase